MKILNLTQHVATAEQIAEGVIEPSPILKDMIRKELTFEELPTEDDVVTHAAKLASIAASEKVMNGIDAVMIGGASYLMQPLSMMLKFAGVKTLHAFTKRVKTEVPQPDGSVKVETTFKHEGFVAM